jgi:predicted NAD-dependent protein-ADP-ribosyltransferase YbiA (DUF1768 family)
VAARSPGAAKALGRQVPGFDQETWDEQRTRALDPDQWLGLNLLGFALMAAREHLTTDTTK